VESGTPEGDAPGFIGDLFSGWLEIHAGNRFYLHYIISRGRDEGNVQALILGWLDRYFAVRVVMPRPIMQHILQKFGFSPALEYFPDHYNDTVEVWRRPGITSYKV
jgi:cyclopropane fatty-acyl-phospholipid synthase-like methyltransferase